MKIRNYKSLESLTLYTHIGGLFSVFIGIVVILLDLFSSDMTHIQTGFYIFATGYALVKISAKLSSILKTEQID